MRITADYALLTTTVGVAVMVQLSKVKYIEVDVREYTVTTRSSGFKIQQTSTVIRNFLLRSDRPERNYLIIFMTDK